MTPPPPDSHDDDVTNSTSNVTLPDIMRAHFTVTTSIPLQQHMAILSKHNPESAAIAPTAAMVYSTEEVDIDQGTTPVPALPPQDPVHAGEEDTIPPPTTTADSNEWPREVGTVTGTSPNNMEIPGTKLLCHPMYKRIVVNGIAYDYIPVCGLPAGFVDESVQDNPRNQREQPPEPTRIVVEDSCLEEIESVTSIATGDPSNNERSQINADSSTDATNVTIESPSTAVPVSQGLGNSSSTTTTDIVTESTIIMDQDVAKDPSRTTVQEATTASISAKSTEKAESIIGSSAQTASSGSTQIIELSDEEEDFEVTAVVPSKRRAQDTTSGEVKDSRTETNTHPKSHNQGTQDCPLEIESDSDSEPSPLSRASEVQILSSMQATQWKVISRPTAQDLHPASTDHPGGWTPTPSSVSSDPHYHLRGSLSATPPIYSNQGPLSTPYSTNKTFQPLPVHTPNNQVHGWSQYPQQTSNYQANTRTTVAHDQHSSEQRLQTPEDHGRGWTPPQQDSSPSTIQDSLSPSSGTSKASTHDDRLVRSLTVREQMEEYKVQHKLMQQFEKAKETRPSSSRPAPPSQSSSTPSTSAARSSGNSPPERTVREPNDPASQTISIDSDEGSDLEEHSEYEDLPTFLRNVLKPDGYDQFATLNAISPAKGYEDDETKDGLKLSPDQMYVIDQVVTKRQNVFFTGSAGTGKSVLLRELILRLKRHHGRWRPHVDYWDGQEGAAVSVTASTGIAACNIGGTTLHSFAGIGLGREKVDDLLKKVMTNNKVMRRWHDTKVLIIDEISMIEGDLLDKIEKIARLVRGIDKSWGGIQMVFAGDFFQLPPVDKKGTAKFAFEAKSWNRTVQVKVELQKIYRQKDQDFAQMLNEMRIGMMSASTINRFRNLGRALVLPNGLRPTRLFPLRTQVDEANNHMLEKLPGEMLIFEAQDRGAAKMEDHCIAPTKLELKVNAQVMLLKNQDGGSGGLVNGSLGIVKKFVRSPAQNGFVDNRPSLNSPGEKLPLVRFTMENGGHRDMVIGREEWTMEMQAREVVSARVQIPLCLAWSLSIHKSQGQTIPYVQVDLGRVFEKGQAYVALSRATTLAGLQVQNFKPAKVMVHPKVIEFAKELERDRDRAN